MTTKGKKHDAANDVLRQLQSAPAPVVTKADFDRLVAMIEAINRHLGITKEAPVEENVEV